MANEGDPQRHQVWVKAHLGPTVHAAGRALLLPMRERQLLTAEGHRTAAAEP